MIKELDIIREPRGLSWQNWAMSCKDTLKTKTPRAMLFAFAGAAVIACLILGRSDVTDLAHRLHLRGWGTGIISDTSPETAPIASKSGQHSVASSSNSSSNSTDTLQPTTATGSALLSTNKVSASTAKSSLATAPTQAVASLCNTATKILADSTRQAAITAENTLHGTGVTLINTSYAVDKLLHPSTFSQRLVDENARHTSVITAVDQTYQTALQQAHCD